MLIGAQDWHFVHSCSYALEFISNVMIKIPLKGHLITGMVRVSVLFFFMECKYR